MYHNKSNNSSIDWNETNSDDNLDDQNISYSEFGESILCRHKDVTSDVCCLSKLNLSNYMPELSFQNTSIINISKETIRWDSLIKENTKHNKNYSLASSGNISSVLNLSISNINSSEIDITVPENLPEFSSQCHIANPFKSPFVTKQNLQPCSNVSPLVGNNKVFEIKHGTRKSTILFTSSEGISTEALLGINTDINNSCTQPKTLNSKRTNKKRKKPRTKKTNQMKTILKSLPSDKSSILPNSSIDFSRLTTGDLSISNRTMNEISNLSGDIFCRVTRSQMKQISGEIEENKENQSVNVMADTLDSISTIKEEICDISLGKLNNQLIGMETGNMIGAFNSSQEKRQVLKKVVIPRERLVRTPRSTSNVSKKKPKELASLDLPINEVSGKLTNRDQVFSFVYDKSYSMDEEKESSMNKRVQGNEVIICPGQLDNLVNEVDWGKSDFKEFESLKDVLQPSLTMSHEISRVSDFARRVSIIDSGGNSHRETESIKLSFNEKSDCLPSFLDNDITERNSLLKESVKSGNAMEASTEKGTQEFTTFPILSDFNIFVSKIPVLSRSHRWITDLDASRDEDDFCDNSTSFCRGLLTESTGDSFKIIDLEPRVCLERIVDQTSFGKNEISTRNFDNSDFVEQNDSQHDSRDIVGKEKLVNPSFIENGEPINKITIDIANRDSGTNQPDDIFSGLELAERESINLECVDHTRFRDIDRNVTQNLLDTETCIENSSIIHDNWTGNDSKPKSISDMMNLVNPALQRNSMKNDFNEKDDWRSGWRQLPPKETSSGIISQDDLPRCVGDFGKVDLGIAEISVNNWNCSPKCCSDTKHVPIIKGKFQKASKIAIDITGKIKGRNLSSNLDVKQDDSHEEKDTNRSFEENDRTVELVKLSSNETSSEIISQDDHPKRVGNFGKVDLGIAEISVSNWNCSLICGGVTKNESCMNDISQKESKIGPDKSDDLSFGNRSSNLRVKQSDFHEETDTNRSFGENDRTVELVKLSSNEASSGIICRDDHPRCVGDFENVDLEIAEISVSNWNCSLKCGSDTNNVSCIKDMFQKASKIDLCKTGELSRIDIHIDSRPIGLEETRINDKIRIGKRSRTKFKLGEKISTKDKNRPVNYSPDVLVVLENQSGFCSNINRFCNKSAQNVSEFQTLCGPVVTDDTEAQSAIDLKDRNIVDVDSGTINIENIKTNKVIGMGSIESGNDRNSKFHRKTGLKFFQTRYDLRSLSRASSQCNQAEISRIHRNDGGLVRKVSQTASYHLSFQNLQKINRCSSCSPKTVQSVEMGEDFVSLSKLDGKKFIRKTDKGTKLDLSHDAEEVFCIGCIPCIGMVDQGIQTSPIIKRYRKKHKAVQCLLSNHLSQISSSSSSISHEIPSRVYLESTRISQANRNPVVRNLWNISSIKTRNTLGVNRSFQTSSVPSGVSSDEDDTSVLETENEESSGMAEDKEKLSSSVERFAMIEEETEISSSENIYEKPVASSTNPVSNLSFPNNVQEELCDEDDEDVSVISFISRDKSLVLNRYIGDFEDDTADDLPHFNELPFIKPSDPIITMEGIYPGIEGKRLRVRVATPLKERLVYVDGKISHRELIPSPETVKNRKELLKKIRNSNLDSGKFNYMNMRQYIDSPDGVSAIFVNPITKVTERKKVLTSVHDHNYINSPVTTEIQILPNHFLPLKINQFESVIKVIYPDRTDVSGVTVIGQSKITFHINEEINIPKGVPYFIHNPHGFTILINESISPS